MNQTAHQMIEQCREEGARLHASWNAPLFEALGVGPAMELWQAMQAETRELSFRKTIFEGYLRLLQEAVGRGYIQRIENGPWSNLLELVFAQYVPEQLTSIKPPKRLEELAKIWNLLEGLLSEPTWINQLVLARALELKQLTGLEPFLVNVLDPVLSPAPSAKFTGPFRQTVLDTRPLDEDFLPGEMTLAAPWVLCIEDRRRPVRLGVLLQKAGKSEFIGPLPEMEPHRDTAKLPRVQAVQNLLQIGEHAVKLPWYNEPHRVCIARAGFVVASALDSQRLWIVETN